MTIISTCELRKKVSICKSHEIIRVETVKGASSTPYMELRVRLLSTVLFVYVIDPVHGDFQTLNLIFD